MKRSWFGAALLLFFLLSGLLITRAMGDIHDPISQDLITAGEYALTENWEMAEAFFQKARQSWEKNRLFRSCFADHNPVEEIESSLAQLEVYARMKEETAFAASCGEISRKIQAIGEAHGLVWENIL